MMEPLFDFNEKLKSGQKSELIFLKRYKDKFQLTQTDGKSGDFLSNGEKLELKSDEHRLYVTGNLFLETIRNTNTNAPGGVIQAVKEHQVEIYMYWFPGENYFFKFDAVALMNAIPELTKNEYPIYIENAGYDTKGYAVKAYRLLPFCIETNAPLKLVNSFRPMKKTPYSIYQMLKSA